MPRMPVLLKAIAHPGSGPADDPPILSIRLLGTRFGRTPENSARWLHPHIRCHRQVHQVDRGEAGLYHVSSQGSRVHPRDNTQVRSAQSDHHRPGHLLHRIRILGLLPGKQHRHVLRLRGPPQVQRPGVTCYWLDPLGAENQDFRPDRKIWLQVDPGTTQSSMGPAHAEKPGRRLLPLLHGLRF